MSVEGYTHQVPGLQIICQYVEEVFGRYRLYDTSNRCVSLGEGFQIQLKDATCEEEKVKLTAVFTSHLEAAQEERDYYLTSLKQAETTLADNRDTVLSMGRKKI